MACQPEEAELGGASPYIEFILKKRQIEHRCELPPEPPEHEEKLCRVFERQHGRKEATVGARCWEADRAQCRCRGGASWSQSVRDGSRVLWWMYCADGAVLVAESAAWAQRETLVDDVALGH